MPDIVFRASPKNMPQTLCPLDSIRGQAMIVWIGRLLAVSDHIYRWLDLG